MAEAKVPSKVNPICLKWWDPAQGAPQRSYFYKTYTKYKMKIDIVDEYYICMALKNSDNV